MSWNSGFQLRVVEGRQKSLMIPLIEQSYVLGRAAQVGETAPGHIFFMEPTVSRTHAEMKWNEKKKQFLIHHRSNTNPTLVEGTPVGKREARPLTPGSEIRMGLLVLCIEAAPAPKAVEAKNLNSINSGLNDGPRDGRLGNKVREPEKAPSLVVGNIIEALNNLTEQKSRETTKVSREDLARAQAHDGRYVVPTSVALEPTRPGAAPVTPVTPPTKVVTAPTSANEDDFLERGFDSPEDSPLGFKVVVAQGPDSGQSFAVTDHLMVIGRSVGREDRRHGMGLLLTDETLPTETAMLVWQSREGSYGLLEAEHNTAPIAVRRVVSGKPVEYGVQPNRPLILQEGDVILLGRTALVLRRTENVAGRGPKKNDGPAAMKLQLPQATRPGASAPQSNDLFRPARREEIKMEMPATEPPAAPRRSVSLGVFEPPALPKAENKMPSWADKIEGNRPSFLESAAPAPSAQRPADPVRYAPTAPELVRPQGGPESSFRRAEPAPQARGPQGEPSPVPPRNLSHLESPTQRVEPPPPPASKLPSVFERIKRPAAPVSMDHSEVPTAVGGTRLDPSNAPTLQGFSPARPSEPTSQPQQAPAPPKPAPPAPAAGGESRVSDAAPVLSWPWKNSSDYVFDFLAGPNKGCQIALMASELVDDRTITMGAATDKSYDVQLETAANMALAAVLRYRSGRFGLLNDGPDDSVSVNRFPLKRGDQVVLMTGDRVDIGDTVFRFLERKVVEFLQGYQVNVESGVEQDQDKAFPFFKQRLLIGRGKNCDIRLNDLEVSRIHIALVHREGKFFIQHRSETNPTFLNGVSLLQGGERLIQPGDRVRLSSLTLLQFGRAEQKRKPITPPSTRPT